MSDHKYEDNQTQDFRQSNGNLIKLPKQGQVLR